jgi:hypothetical protein
MEESRNKLLNCLSTLEDAYVVAKYRMNLHEADSIVVARDFIMRTAKITEQELSEYQINRRVETFKEGK